LCGEAAVGSRLIEEARREAIECFNAAHIPFAAEGEDMATREHTLHLAPIDGQRRGGGSTWQSLATEAGRTETDYLNGEIVLLGRLHGVATPVNELLQWLTNQAAREGAEPGRMTVDQIEGLLARQ
jgi:2-dehydropantoate 2-reductase